MSSIGATLLKCLRSVEQPGDFCVGGLREVLMPAIDVDGVGRISYERRARQRRQDLDHVAALGG